MAIGLSARYDSRPWSRRAKATREWLLEVEEEGGVDGQLGSGQLLPDELLSTAGLDLALTAGQRAGLSRLELAAFTDWQMRFEAVVQAGFAKQVATAPRLCEGRITFLLHEIGEEAGHQRVFQRLLSQLPADDVAMAASDRQVFERILWLVMRYPAVLFALVLAGEEIVDRFQEAAADHPGTDPFVRQVYDYHRTEEANHVAFVQAVYAQAWVAATPVERVLVHRLVPRLIGRLFDATVRAEHYEAVGAEPGVWHRVQRSEHRARRRAEAATPVLEALIEAGALSHDALPRPWQELCGITVR